MNDEQIQQDEDALTLDTPGSIAVIGGGALGVEAALYGRFLGYDVTLIEAGEIGQSMRDHMDDPLPMLPDRCLSGLAKQALVTHFGDAGLEELPLSLGQWVTKILVPLTQTDLFRGRVRDQTLVTKIETVVIEEDDGDSEEADREIPPDFRLTLKATEGAMETMEAEAVILAIGPTTEIELGFPLPAPYFHRVGKAGNQPTTDDAERNLAAGLQEIVAIFAGLVGRTELDLYRPRRR